MMMKLERKREKEKEEKSVRLKKKIEKTEEKMGMVIIREE